MLKSYNSICKINLRETFRIQQFGLCSVTSKNNIENSNAITSQVLKKEQEILKVINKCNLTYLKKHITPSIAKIIISGRDINGFYKSLDDFILRNNIQSETLNKFYDSVINYKPKEKRRKNKSVITPEILPTEIPQTTIGIHVGQNLVTWAVVTKNLNLLQWDCIPWYDEDPSKSSYNVIKLITRIFQKLPKCDVYVTEDIYLKNKSCPAILSCQQQLTVTIMGCLKLMENQRTGDSLDSRMYVLQPRASAYFYNLIVGFEMVSTNYVIKMIMNNNIQANNDKSLDLLINDTLKTKYLRADIYEQEQMGWSLLKALMFIHLVRSSTTV